LRAVPHSLDAGSDPKCGATHYQHAAVQVSLKTDDIQLENNPEPINGN